MPEQIDLNNPPLESEPAFPAPLHMAHRRLSKREVFFAIAFHAGLTRPIEERTAMVKSYGDQAIAKWALAAADRALKVLEEA